MISYQIFHSFSTFSTSKLQ